MLEVKFLGQFEVNLEGRRIAIPTRNAQALFAYLALNAGPAYRRERLAGLFWPDSSEDNARSNLRHELWRLRKAFGTQGEVYFPSDDLTITFRPGSDIFLDVKTLESAPAEGTTAQELIAALAAYRGELLPGFYEEWVFAERDRLFALFEARIARLLEILQSEGRWAEVLEWGMHWIAMGHWPEPAYRALMLAYANSGDIGKAIASYERLAQGLQKELGVKPSDQTQALYKRIKAGWKPETQPAAHPIQVAAPPGESAQPSPVIARLRLSNLPRPLTSFIGRDREIQEVESLVSKARLVTITGSGGVGKTRLAIQVADRLKPLFKDGVWWVELAPISGLASFKQVPPDWPEVSINSSAIDLVTQAVAKVLHISEVPGQPLLAGIIEHLQEKRLLLVLDNCEHLIQACASVAERILSDSPQATILATSREPLAVPGERAWTLPPLSLPEQGHISDIRRIFQSEAVNLFLERSTDVLPGYIPGETEARTIAQLCLRLDGIPLAIELAAARMNLLSAQEIAARLDRRFSLLTDGSRTALPRHQTLLAAIEWSHDLLSESERILFRRLAIFSGSFTLEAAEAVCPGGPIQPDEVLSLVGRLVDKSLLTVEPKSRNVDLPTRYRFLDTICSYGRLKLDEANEEREMRNRHADYYVFLAEAAEVELLSTNQVCWHNLLQAENDNLRRAILWSSENDPAENALRIVGALMWYWFRKGNIQESSDLALHALTSPLAFSPGRARARALNTAGFFLCMLGETNTARLFLEEAIAILQDTENKADLAWSLWYLGLVYSYEKEYDLADQKFSEGASLTREIGVLNVSNFLFFHGDVDLQKGDRSRARKKYEESVATFRGIHNKGFLAYPLRRLGYMALEENDTIGARSYLFESLLLNHDSFDIIGVTASLLSMAILAIRLEKTLLAARLLGAVENRLETLSVNLLSLDQIELGRARSLLNPHLDEAPYTAAFTEGWNMSDEQITVLVEGIFGEVI